jgi:transcriptional regulator GlxA family with amidase domain
MNRYESDMAVRSPLRVQVLALEGCTTLVPVGFMDLLRKGAELAERMSSRAPRRVFTLELVSAQRSRDVAGAGGLILRCDTTVEKTKPGDLVLVPALDPDVFDQLERNRAAVDFIKRAFAGGADVASACTGAFMLAEAGCLDKRLATTHWAFQPLFAERYPKVRLAPQSVLVDSGRVVTSGGATSFINLALLLVEKLLGAEVARASSRMFLIDVNKAPQGAYAMFSTQKTHDDEAIHRAQVLIEERLELGPLVEALARELAMATRTFVRRFKSATGNSPREYIQRMRIEAARRELEAGSDSVTAIARRVGYSDPVAFRKLFSRITGLTPADYRARYGPKTSPSYLAAYRR